MDTEASSPVLHLNGAQLLVRLLLQEGISTAFGVVGGKLGPLLQALADSPIRFVGVRHEAAAPMMAAAVQARSGQMALALAEMGPGGLNLAAGAGVAFNNRLPVLLITTNQHRAACYPHRGVFMDMDTRAVLAPLTRWNAVVNDARRLPELVRTAFREALGPQPGPVHLDIPHDVLLQTLALPADAVEVQPARYRATVAPRPAVAQVAQAVALLTRARRVLIVAGGGVVQSGAEAGLQALAERLGAAVITTQSALGVLPHDHPACVGQGGLIATGAVAQAFEEADTVLALGCRFSSWLWDERGPLVRRHQHLVQVNTDPAALGAPALHSLGLQADAGQALADLLAALPDAARPADADLHWCERLQARRQQAWSALQALADDTTLPQHPARWARAIGQALPDDALVVFDGGHTSFWSNDFTPATVPRSRFHDAGMCQLGFGLPYALALQQLHPERWVLNLTGDGAFGFTVQELDTARRYRLPVITLVHHNAAWGVIRHGQRKALDFELATSLDGTDYAAIARGFGCFGEVLHDVAELPAALARARASGLPAVLDCRTRFEPHPCMPAFGRMNRHGWDPA